MGAGCGQVAALGIPVSSREDVQAQRAEAATVRAWRLQGLPEDDHFTGNAVIAIRSQRWPLLVDPQARAPRVPAGPPARTPGLA
jgi:hypothetical protein